MLGSRNVTTTIGLRIGVHVVGAWCLLLLFEETSPSLVFSSLIGDEFLLTAAH